MFFFAKDWPDDALELVANKFLDDVEINDEIRQQTIEMCKVFHKSVVTLSTRFFFQTNYWLNFDLIWIA